MTRELSSVQALAALLGLVTCCWGIIPFFAALDRRDANRTLWSFAMAAGGIGLIGLAVAIFLTGDSTYSIPFPISLGNLRLAFRFDSLGMWFLGVIALVSIPVACYLHGYVEHLKTEADLRLFWPCLGILLLSMAMVVLSANALTFLVFWELMSISSFLLVATEHGPRKTRHAALVYLGATRIGTALLAGGFLWTYAKTGSLTFADWHLSGLAALGPGLLLLFGLGVKAGMWPLHFWLPTAHPAAPSPVSALMSGLMVKVAICIMIRFFILPARFTHPFFAAILLILGAISAFWGVASALLQHDLKRLLAFHTIENIGLILLALGVSLWGHDQNLPFIAKLGLAAALFHVANHALFKSLLFLSAGSVNMSARTRDIEKLGGVAKVMPYTFASFLLGSAAICALPPLNGFASEWLLYQSFLRVAEGRSAPLISFIALLVIGWIALTGALALACFMKATGVVFLGRPRSSAIDSAHEASTGMLIGQGALGVLCILFGVLAPWVLMILQPIVGRLDPGGSPLVSAWTIPTGTILALLVLTAGAAMLWISNASKRMPVRSFITWECGFGNLTPRMQATGTSLAQPIVSLFRTLFRQKHHLEVEGENYRLFPEEISSHTSTEPMLELNAHIPFVKGMRKTAHWLAVLQGGNIHFYLLTMLLTLLALIFLGGHLP